MNIPMDSTVKKTIAVIISACVLFVAYYGSYLPVRKAQTFIGTLQGFQTTPPSSLQDLESRLAIPLDAYSPIGQEEIVRNAANSVLSLVQNGIDATSTGDLISFLNTYYDPILARGKGMSFGQDLYIEGAVNEVAFSTTGNASYLLQAQKYYAEARTLGPDRPQALYGLFDVYRAEGDVTNTIAIADKILANWPAETSIPGALAQFLASMHAATGTKTTGK